MLTCVRNGFQSWSFVHEPNEPHTYGVQNFEKLAYMVVSSASERLLLMCPRGNHNNSD
jgi:hypothetical protein